MITDRRFVIIAGTARDVGKTTLACKIISENAHRPIVALKFVTLKKSGVTHSHHPDIDAYGIFEETNLDSEKDTVKMLKSGAKQSFLVVSYEEYVKEALDSFLGKLNKDTLVVSESATLRKYIVPCKFIIVDREGAVNKKDYIQELIPMADHLVMDILDPLQIEEVINLQQ